MPFHEVIISKYKIFQKNKNEFIHAEYHCKLYRVHKMKLYPYIHYKKYSFTLHCIIIYTVSVPDNSSPPLYSTVCCRAETFHDFIYCDCHAVTTYFSTTFEKLKVKTLTPQGADLIFRSPLLVVPQHFCLVPFLPVRSARLER